MHHHRLEDQRCLLHSRSRTTDIHLRQCSHAILESLQAEATRQWDMMGEDHHHHSMLLLPQDPAIQSTLGMSGILAILE